ncbi:MAG TPA: glycosyltransferase [Symbiobacteriaceae bacterium]|nr:glycosyltransferase [Symbiobacteriaceae bacterium]
MWAVVLPAKDEAARIGPLLQQVLRLPVGLIIPVINGSNDMTEGIVGRVEDPRVRSLYFAEPLGYDVPRIVGALYARQRGARAVLFVDADLTGKLDGLLIRLAQAVTEDKLDLALTDCYAETPVPFRESAAKRVYEGRVALNEALGRPDLGPAIPSHGPVAISRRLLQELDPALLGVPPLCQAVAVKRGLRVGVAGRLPHRALGSAPRPVEHQLKIAETILGDCRAGTNWAKNGRPDREGHDGYHSERRFDLTGYEAPERALATPVKKSTIKVGWPT